MPKVLNKYTYGTTASGITIDRTSKWGNPFKIGPNGTRKEVIKKYEQWLLKQPKLVALAKKELKGRDLLCWCAPLPCHGDVLLRIANEEN